MRPVDTPSGPVRLLWGRNIRFVRQKPLSYPIGLPRQRPAEATKQKDSDVEEVGI